MHILSKTPLPRWHVVCGLYNSLITEDGKKVFLGIFEKCTPIDLQKITEIFRCANDHVVECWTCDHELAGSNLGCSYCAANSNRPSVPTGVG